MFSVGDDVCVSRWFHPTAGWQNGTRNCLITEKRKEKPLEWNTVVFCCSNMQRAAATCQTLGNNVGGSFVGLRRRPDQVPPLPLHLDVLPLESGGLAERRTA